MIKLGDCLEGLRALPDNSVDSIVTDPPYGLSFMGKKWDYDVPPEEVWRECLRVLKPGGHLLAFAGTRTQHRMAVRIEDAGFEIRDMIAWVYASGFPKSLDVSKAIDKAAGAEREVVAKGVSGRTAIWADGGMGDFDITAPATDAALQWQGWGTALKPALEPITMARKPLGKGMTVASNVLAHGTGALNIDGCRVETDDTYAYPNGAGGSSFTVGGGIDGSRTDTPSMHPLGRWPANLIHDGSDEVLAGFPQAKGAVSNGRKGKAGIFEDGIGAAEQRPRTKVDSGSAARFFYCAKASKRDRDEGLEGFEVRPTAAMAGNMVDGQRLSGTGQPIATPTRANHHPTVKPTDLMRYLCRLVTPPGGVVLDPFMGSGSTGKAAMLEGFRFIGCELSPEYLAIAEARISAVAPEVLSVDDLI